VSLNSARDRSVYIYSVGLTCALGKSFSECRMNYANGERHFRRNETVTDNCGHSMTLGDVIGYEGLRDYPERLLRLCASAVSDLDNCGAIPLSAVMRVMLPEWLENSPIINEVRASIAFAARGKAQSLTVTHGNAAHALSQLGAAAADILAGAEDAIIVGALDSFMQAELLDILALQGRILTKENHYGSVPSEGACFMLLASDHLMRGLHPIGQILAVFRGKEMEDITSPKGIVGRGLAAPFTEAANYATPDRLISDMNGERWRAEEFGFAVSSVGPPMSKLAREVETPALYVGDSGVAAGPIFAALALTGPPERGGVDTGPVGMISISSRSAERAVMFIEKFSPPAEEAV
jgi:hypothetical protein